MSTSCTLSLFPFTEVLERPGGSLDTTKRNSLRLVCLAQALWLGSVQAALDARIMRPEEVRAAVRESADLGQWLGNKAHKLFTMPLEIVAFSDEEGVRWPALPQFNRTTHD